MHQNIYESRKQIREDLKGFLNELAQNTERKTELKNRFDARMIALNIAAKPNSTKFQVTIDGATLLPKDEYDPKKGLHLYTRLLLPQEQEKIIVDNLLDKTNPPTTLSYLRKAFKHVGLILKISQFTGELSAQAI